jgi:hypothetical protein
MMRIDLRERPVTVDELLKLASAGAVVIVSREGTEYVVEAADAFDREATQLGGSAEFMSFLAERSREPGTVSIEDVERRLGIKPGAPP